MLFFLQDQDGRGKDGERPKLERQESRLSSDSQDDSARESSSEGKSMFVCFYKILFANCFSIRIFFFFFFLNNFLQIVPLIPSWIHMKVGRCLLNGYLFISRFCIGHEDHSRTLLAIPFPQVTGNDSVQDVHIIC